MEQKQNASQDSVPESNVMSLEDTLTSRLKMIIGSESVASFARRSGVGESLLRKYLSGSAPSAHNALLLSDAGGCTTDWLIAGRAPRMRFDTTYIPDDSTETFSPEGCGEFELLKGYRQADAEQKKGVLTLLHAIANPSGLAWYQTGKAIARLANKSLPFIKIPV